MIAWFRGEKNKQNEMFVVVSATPNSHPEYNLQRNTGSTGEEDGAYLFLRSSNIRPQSMFVFVVPATPQQIKQSWSWYSKKNKKQKTKKNERKQLHPTVFFTRA